MKLSDEEITRMMADITPEQAKEELRAAGWTKVISTVWMAPNEDCYLGPFGAWREMKRREQV